MDQLYNSNNKMLLLKLLWWRTTDIFFCIVVLISLPKIRLFASDVMPCTHGVGWGGGIGVDHIV